MNFVIKALKEYKATVKYFRDEFPFAFSVTKTVISAVFAQVILYILYPESLGVITLGNVIQALVRVAITSLAYRLEIPTEVKSSNI